MRNTFNHHLIKIYVLQRSQTRGLGPYVARERVQCGPRTSGNMQIFQGILSQLVYFSKTLSFNSMFFLHFFKYGPQDLGFILMRPARQFEFETSDLVHRRVRIKTRKSLNSESGLSCNLLYFLLRICTQTLKKFHIFCLFYLASSLIWFLPSPW
jgi:hypothetical protein